MQSTTAINGSDVILYVDVGTAEDPDWQPVACQRGLSISEQANMINVSCKGSEIEQNVYGRITGTITLDAVIVESPQGLEFLRGAMWDKKEVIIRRAKKADKDEYAEDAFALIESVEQNYPEEDASTFSVSLRINSKWEKVVEA